MLNGARQTEPLRLPLTTHLPHSDLPIRRRTAVVCQAASAPSESTVSKCTCRCRHGSAGGSSNESASWQTIVGRTPKSVNRSASGQWPFGPAAGAPGPAIVRTASRASMWSDAVAGRAQRVTDRFDPVGAIRSQISGATGGVETFVACRALTAESSAHAVSPVTRAVQSRYLIRQHLVD